MTAVLVVEDQHALASALEVAIGAQPDLECLGAAGTVDEALGQMSSHVPDVVLMDIQLPGSDGIEGTRKIMAAYPDVSVLILTANATAGQLAAAAAAGAAGFLTKDSSFPDILDAIRNPVGGKLVIEGTTLRALIDELSAAEMEHGVEPAEPAERAGQVRGGQVPGWARLTAREQEVLALMGEGLDPKAIAERLVVSLHTARGHVKSVMMKLGAHSQLEAVVVATRAGLLPHDGAPSARLCAIRALARPPRAYAASAPHVHRPLKCLTRHMGGAIGPSEGRARCRTGNSVAVCDRGCTQRFLASRAGYRSGVRKFPVSMETAGQVGQEAPLSGCVRVMRGYARTLAYLVGIICPSTPVSAADRTLRG